MQDFKGKGAEVQNACIQVAALLLESTGDTGGGSRGQAETKLHVLISMNPAAY